VFVFRCCTLQEGRSASEQEQEWQEEVEVLTADLESTEEELLVRREISNLKLETGSETRT